MSNTNASIPCGSMTSFYDSGGPNSKYQNNESYEMTICAPAGQTMFLQFNSFSTEAGDDILTVYDGNSTSAPVLGAFSGASLPPTMSSTGNCLTITFESDNNSRKFGWWAFMGCGSAPPPPTPPSGDCSDSQPFCTANDYLFPAAINTTAQVGPNYGCLDDQPNPAWYYLQIDQSGTINLTISSTSQNDIDFAIWGPFNSMTNICNQLTNAPLDCSYTTSDVETGSIPSAVPGQYYVLLITNYSNEPTDILFQQTGGSGGTNCDILCNLVSVTATPGACDPGSNTYDLSGVLQFTDPPTSGTLVVSHPSGVSFSIPGPWTSPLNYTLTGITSTGVATSVTAAFSADPLCTLSHNYTSPAPCIPTCTVTASNDGPACVGEDVTLSATLVAGATGYQWSGPGGYAASGQSVSLTGVTAADAGSYTVTVSGPAVCTSSTSVTVNVPSTAAITPVGPLCSNGSSQNLTATLSPGVWSGTGITNVSLGSFDPALAGTGSHGITFTPSGSCTLPGTTTIQVLALADPTVTDISPLCQNASAVQLSAADAGGTWSGTGVNASGLFDPSGLAANTYTITYTIAGACGGSDNTAVVVQSYLDPTITDVLPLCQNALPVTLVTATAGGTWSGTGVNASGVFDPSGLAANTYTLTYTTSGACGGSDNSNVVVNAVADPTITDIGPLCPSDAAVQLSAADAGGTWSGTGVNASGLFDPSGLAANTYTITYTIAGACGGSDNTAVVVQSYLDPTITDVLPLCQNALPVTLVTATAGGTWSGTGVNASGVFDPAGLAANTYTLTYTTTGACGGSDNSNVVVNAVADPTITDIGPLCPSDAAVQLSAADAGGTWSGTGVNASGLFDPSGLAANTYTITYTIAGACGGSDNTAVVVQSYLDPTITDVLPLCQNALPVTLVTATAGGTWSGTGVNASGVFDPSGLAANTYTLTYTTSGACGGSDNSNVVVNAVADPTITDIGPLCPSDAAVQLSAVDAGGTWSGTGVNASGLFDPSGLAANTYTITYTIAGACGGADNTAVVIQNTLDPTITDVGPFCDNAGSVTLQAVDAGGSWSGLGVDAAGVFDPTIVAAGTYTITYTLGGTCGGSDQTVIQVDATSNATVMPAGPFCSDAASVALQVVDAGGAWTGTGVDATGNFDPAGLAAGTYTVTYSFGGGCPSSGSIDVEVLLASDATIVDIPSVCSNAVAFPFAAASPGGSWSGTGIDNAGLFDPQGLTPGVYTVTYAFGGLCPSSDVSDIEVIQAQDGTIDPVTPMCPEALPFTLTAATAGGTWASAALSNPALGVFGSAVTTPGNYPVTYTLVGNCGGVWNTTVTVLNPGNPQITDPGNVCTNSQPFGLNASPPGGTFSSSDFNLGANGQLFPASLAAGSYTVEYHLNQNGCPRVDSLNITVFAPPQPFFTGDVLVGCEPLDVSFVSNATALGMQENWYIDGVLSSGAVGTYHAVLTNVGCHDILLTQIDSAGCQASFGYTDYVCIDPLPVAAFTWDPLMPSDVAPTVNFTNASSHYTTATWHYQSASVQSTDWSMVFQGTEGDSVMVCLEVTGNQGCADQTCHTLAIDQAELVYVPSAFTPGYDNLNEAFGPVISGLDHETIVSYTFIVFDRWGMPLFKTDDPEQKWNGNVQGGQYYAENGVYNYYLEIILNDDTTLKRRGSINLIR